MKRHLLFFAFIASTAMVCHAQNNIDTTKQIDIVHLPEYYKEKGVIFNKDYAVGIDMQRLQSRYTPTMQDIKKAEKIFSDKYNEVQKTNIDTKVLFCHWVRQYVGFIDSNSKKNIIVQFIDNRKPRKINHLLGKNWADVFIIMLADSFYNVSNRFRINIDTGEMSTKL